MANFMYGDPANRTAVMGPKPPCWGTSKFDNEDRECRTCGFQNTCREQTIRAKSAVAPTTSYFSQFQPPTSYAVPQTIVQNIPVPPAPQQMRVPVAPSPQVVPQQPGLKDRYGQFTDPLFATIKSTPSVVRPQFPGETYPERIAKNMMLSSIEGALGELILGVRQFLWTPSHDEEEKK